MAYYFSKNPITKVVPSNGASVVRLEIQVEPTYEQETYTTVCTLQLSPGQDGNCTFRLESILDAVVESDLVADALDLSLPFQVNTKSIRQFNLVVTRLDGSGNQIDTESLGINTVVWGALPFRSAGAGSELSIPQSLHSRPAGLVVRRSNLYLSVLAWLQMGSTQVRYRFLSPGGTERIVDSNALGLPSMESVWHIRLDQWPEPSELASFEVSVLQGGTPILGPFTFEEDRTEYPYERHFLFRNSRGGWEQLNTTGTGIEKLEGEKQVAERLIGPTYLPTDARQFIWRQDILLKMKVNSGWFPSQEQARWLMRELALSMEAFEILDGQKIPIVITTRSLESYQDENFLTAFSFEYTYAQPFLSSVL